MGRPSSIPLTEEGAEMVRAYLRANPDANISSTCHHFRCSRLRLHRLCEVFGIVTPGHYRKVQTAARGFVGDLFRELERRGINQVQIARELQRSPFFVLGVRAGTIEPRLFDVECLATLAGMKLTVTADKRV